MRQRRGAVVLEPAQSGGTLVETLKTLDVYPKTLDDFKERTGSGAAVSIISVCSILLVIFSELRAYMTSVTTDHLYVDTTRGERIRINANITFPNLPCAGLKCAGASPLLQHADSGLPGLPAHRAELPAVPAWLTVASLP